MNAAAHAPGHPGSGLAEAIYFRSSGQHLFGWLHRGQTHISHDLGLVICSPFGYETTCAHRTIRRLAENASLLGVPTLRFDYLGTGDAEDMDPSTNQLDRWTEDTEAAVAELQRLTGVTNVVLLGIRLGAVMATKIAARSPAARGLVLIAPVASGPAYLRELNRVRLGAAMAGGIDAAALQRQAKGIRDLDVTGFTLSAASIEQLAKLDLGSIALPPTVRTLLIDSERITEGRELARRWGEESQTQVSYQVQPGFEKMVATPLRAVVPLAILQAVHDWLADQVRDLNDSNSSNSPPAAELADFAPLPAAGNHTGTITERPVFIDSNSTLLFGIVTEPVRDERRKRAVVLLNTGADYHIGANRMHVSLARRWAENGYVALRIDLGGLGDSSTRTGCEDDVVFPPEALADVASSIDFLKSRYGIESIAIGGVCSGAYHALRAAAAGLPVTQVLLVNPQNYFWKPEDSLDDLQLVEVIRYPTAYLFRMFSKDTWRRVFSGGVRFPRVARIYVERFWLAVNSVFREFARRLKIPISDDLGAELQAIAARGVRMSFIFAKNEAGAQLLYLQGGSTVRRLGDNCRVHILDVGDHIFSQRSDREIMETVVTAELLKTN
jgi:alpha-beta hydrolase superfamily lysophospholipase